MSPVFKLLTAFLSGLAAVAVMLVIFDKPTSMANNSVELGPAPVATSMPCYSVNEDFNWRYIQRCENQEAVCYVTIKGISCIKKGTS